MYRGLEFMSQWVKTCSACNILRFDSQDHKVKKKVLKEYWDSRTNKQQTDVNVPGGLYDRKAK